MLSLLATLITANLSMAADFPPLVIPDNFGVNVHGTQGPLRQLDLIYDAGFRIIRMDVSWPEIEKVRGQYDFSKLDPFVQAMVKHKIRPLMLLSNSNTLYEAADTASPMLNGKQRAKLPQSSQGQSGFASFSAAAAKHFSYANPIFEIWNEPENAHFPSADYVALANGACQAIKAADPSATVVGPAAAKVPTYFEHTPQFLKDVIVSGFSACADAISVHPYLHVDNLDFAPSMWSYIRATIKDNIPAGSHMPIVVNTEWGLSNYLASINEKTQGSYLVRMMLLNFASAVPVSLWYDWQDGAGDPHSPELHYGVRLANMQPKVAYNTMKVMTTLLSGSKFGCRLADTKATQLLLSNDRTYKKVLAVWSNPGLVPWTAEDPSSLTITTKLKFTGGVDMLGQPIKIESTNGTARLSGGAQPFYLDVDPNTTLASVCPANPAH